MALSTTITSEPLASTSLSMGVTTVMKEPSSRAMMYSTPSVESDASLIPNPAAPPAAAAIHFTTSGEPVSTAMAIPNTAPTPVAIVLKVSSSWPVSCVGFAAQAPIAIDAIRNSVKLFMLAS
jgi:hypothetical protein